MSDQGEDVDPQEFLRAVLRISPKDAERVRAATPGTRQRAKSATCEEARARLRAAEQALQPFNATTPLPENRDAPSWDDATRTAYQQAVRERNLAELEVAELCGQYGPTEDYGEG